MPIKEIREELDTSAPAIAPRIKELEENGLVERNNNSLKLTEVGELLSEKLKQLLDTTDLIEKEIRAIGINTR